MKKTLLALAITALSANAFAVNLDNPTAVGGAPQVFAQEIKVAAAGTDIGTNKIVANVNAGFSLPAGFVRFDLTNGAKFKVDPVLTSVANTVAAGGAGQSYVIFNFTAPVTPATALTLTTGATGITVVNKSAVGISYGIYETAGNATTQTGNLNAKSGTLLSFAPALEVKATPGAALKIDAIGSESKKFANATAGGPAVNVTPLTTLTADVVASAPLKIDGSAAVTYADIIASEKWVLNGNFSAVAAAGLNGGATVGTIAADKLSVSYAATPAGAVTYTVTGTTEIAETAVSAVYTPSANGTYEASPVTIAAGKLEKNGTTQSVDLALNPGGQYNNFVRISNKDTIPGAFFIKVINDAGESASFPLSAIPGQPATLAAGASTTQLDIKDIFAAAADKGLTLSGDKKLRLEVTGQTNNLSVQSYTTEKNGNMFSTF